MLNLVHYVVCDAFIEVEGIKFYSYLIRLVKS